MKIVLSKLRTTIALLGIGAVMLLVAGTASAASICLYAGAFDKTLPDGTTVRMWGYGEEADCDLGNGVQAVVTSPGPVIRTTDADLDITLFNGLPEVTSLMIHGKALPAGSAPTWTAYTAGAWTDNTIAQAGGARPDAASRVRSFTFETPPWTAPGDQRTYSFSNLTPGTYLYQTATHPAKQAQMGLVGAVVNDAGATYDADAVLVFSEIDPVLHEAVATGVYGTGAPVPSTGEPMTSTIDYEPAYFLVNGQPYSAAAAPIDLGILAVDDVVMLRLVNAALDNIAPTIPSGYLEVVAEGGSPYPFSRMATSLDLPAGQTMDALLTLSGDGYTPIFDRRLHLSNAGAPGGGFLAFLQVGSADQTLTVTPAGSGGGTITAIGDPGGIDCPGTCSASYVAGTELTLHAEPDSTSEFSGWSGACTGTADCVVTMDTAKAVTATFTTYFPTGSGVKVLSPNGGEKLKSGDLTFITWAASVDAVAFDLAYSLNNGTSWTPIVADVSGNRHFWVVAVPTAGSSKVLVRVTGYDGSGAVVGTDVSDAVFAIETVRLTAPNGGETIVSGDTVTISWDTFATLKPITSVQLHYSLTGTKGWKKIANFKKVNPGSYVWTVPGKRGTTTSPTAVVRVTIKSGSKTVGQDISDAPFTLTLQPVQP